MKKVLMLSFIAMCSLTASLASCGGRPERTSTTLELCIYDGGYGEEWVKAVCEDYETKTGIHVNYTMDSSLLDRIQNQLSGESQYDIFMSHDINWQTYAAQGWLAPLDDLYKRVVDGTNQTFANRLVDGALENSKAEGEDGTEHYYKVCYTQGAGGLVYNVDLFEKNNWKVPETYDELVELCKTISSTPIPGGDRGATYSPFAWSGSDRQYYWDYLVFPWWYELAGADKINTILEYKGPDGKYSDGYEMYNPETYYKEFIQAYDMWYNLVAVSENNNSIDNAYSTNLVTAQSAFANQTAAMIPYGQWAQYEIKNSTHKEDLGFDIEMMKTPTANPNSTTHYNYLVGFGDSMIIPASSPYIEEAKDFLAYLATYDACKIFVEKSEGAFLAFDYSDVDLSDLAESDSYIYSMSKILTECENFNLVSQNPITIWNTNAVMPWIENKYYYQNACSDPTANSPENVGEAMYTTARQGWSSWLMNAGLSD